MCNNTTPIIKNKNKKSANNVNNKKKNKNESCEKKTQSSKTSTATTKCIQMENSTNMKLKQQKISYNIMILICCIVVHSFYVGYNSSSYLKEKFITNNRSASTTKKYYTTIKMTLSNIASLLNMSYGTTTFAFTSASNITVLGTVAPTTIHNTTTKPTLTTKIMNRMITKLFHLKTYNKAIKANPIVLLNKENTPVEIVNMMSDYHSLIKQTTTSPTVMTTTTLTTKIMNRMITKLFHLKKYNKAITDTYRS